MAQCIWMPKALVYRRVLLWPCAHVRRLSVGRVGPEANCQSVSRVTSDMTPVACKKIQVLTLIWPKSGRTGR